MAGPEGFEFAGVECESSGSNLASQGFAPEGSVVRDEKVVLGLLSPILGQQAWMVAVSALGCGGQTQNERSIVCWRT